MPPLPPEAHAGERWTTTSTFRLFALAAFTLSFIMPSACWSHAPGAGCSCSQLAQSRTQPAPSSEAVCAIGRVWPSVSLTPVSTAWAGVTPKASAASRASRSEARRERMPPTSSAGRRESSSRGSALGRAPQLLDRAGDRRLVERAVADGERQRVRAGPPALGLPPGRDRPARRAPAAHVAAVVGERDAAQPGAAAVVERAHADGDPAVEALPLGRLGDPDRRRRAVDVAAAAASRPDAAVEPLERLRRRLALAVGAVEPVAARVPGDGDVLHPEPKRDADERVGREAAVGGAEEARLAAGRHADPLLPRVRARVAGARPRRLRVPAELGHPDRLRPVAVVAHHRVDLA